MNSKVSWKKTKKVAWKSSLGKGIISTKTVKKNLPPKNSKKSHFWPNIAVIKRKFIYDYSQKCVLREVKKNLSKNFVKEYFPKTFFGFSFLQFSVTWVRRKMAQNHQKYVFSTIFLSYDFLVLLFLKWQVGQSKKSDENKNRTKNLLCKSSSCRKYDKFTRK